MDASYSQSGTQQRLAFETTSHSERTLSISRSWKPKRGPKRKRGGGSSAGKQRGTRTRTTKTILRRRCTPLLSLAERAGSQVRSRERLLYQEEGGSVTLRSKQRKKIKKDRSILTTPSPLWNPILQLPSTRVEHVPREGDPLPAPELSHVQALLSGLGGEKRRGRRSDEGGEEDGRRKGGVQGGGEIAAEEEVERKARGRERLISVGVSFCGL